MTITIFVVVIFRIAAVVLKIKLFIRGITKNVMIGVSDNFIQFL